MAELLRPIIYHITNIHLCMKLVYVSPSHSPGTWTHLTASFVFKRRLGYAFGQIYVPTVMIVMLSWLSFWISEKSVPARVALGATTVLTIVTLMGSFRSSVPKVRIVWNNVISVKS